MACQGAELVQRIHVASQPTSRRLRKAKDLPKTRRKRGKLGENWRKTMENDGKPMTNQEILVENSGKPMKTMKISTPRHPNRAPRSCSPCFGTSGALKLLYSASAGAWRPLRARNDAFSIGFPMVFHHFSSVFRWFSPVFSWFSLVFRWFSVRFRASNGEKGPKRAPSRGTRAPRRRSESPGAS